MLRQVALKLGPSADGLPLAFDPHHLTVFVGPSNSGKSLMLRKVYQTLGPVRLNNEPLRRVVELLGPNLADR